MTSYVIIIAIILVLMLRERELKPSRMWITPVLFIWLACSSMSQSPDLSPSGLLFDTVGLIVGIIIGYWRGTLDQVRIHPVTGKVTAKSSVIGVIIFIGIMLLRYFVGYWGAHHALISLSTAIMFIPLGSMCMRRYFLYRKYQKLVG
ncbi:hypothetical protein BVG16_29115 [Paenibacillus selenitireducens]|uniref:DUF1453 domain-containing protein n=1 Tax=Paenibacillus selenitireducens TaxID=1324314 RepID=A0A1T2X1E6_9BACL|nr:CcdC protein domain-containing protein [Paenibacillus selenitireducens]OPA73393.1 hypothetical protein BVG16_29115 [Paenibacillus selenitireducens]